ncbi:Uncharacterized protein conserved in cyanobacteria [Gloeomargarita lithophora Alchichica-D10]|uniref:Uncharacterized protein conserved in cyanobacteria n=1 Tax=Gloeomargarita lithophora Alchichica-D10 TaxID=1188229 RepID=A0A1J0AE78_9CYAN|nr:Uma2 family endonuclease [Gloeomargarita lithophora]APB34237.1 Uncharacterized protein conserved in cyanobacteria [Gloeomargarita lithophora Alchichica-D10]
MQSPDYFVPTSAYLEAEAKSKIRHEYIGGHIFAMAGASDVHNLIAISIISRLYAHLSGSPCRVFMSDMKVKINVQEADIFYYPDILVTCDPTDNQKLFKTKPKLIIEILSPSTEIIDRREKFLHYQSIPSLEEYILISQEEMHIEIFRPNSQGYWVKELLKSEDTLRLRSLNFDLALSEIYENGF